jgi:hypothetical protein
MMIIIKDNFVAFMVNHFMIAFGFLMAGIASYLFSLGTINAYYWMLFAGLGLYLSYVPFNALFFERLIATFRYTANVGFLMYISDSFGYMGSLSVLLYKEFGMSHSALWSPFMTNLIMGSSILGIIGITFSFFYFNRKYRRA